MILKRQFVDHAIKRGAIFYVSHSGGKDSQWLYAVIKDIVPHDQVVVIHADLGEIEWEGVQDHILHTIDHELNVVRAGKTFFEMVLTRFKKRPDVPSWPSSSTRQCTSDLKRGPIHKFIRHDMKARGAKLALNCTGIRGEESPARSKKSVLSICKTLTIKGRMVFDFMPIHHVKEAAVFLGIKLKGQKPFHAYARNTRLSCVFCIMGSENDLRHGAEARPELYQKYLEIEAQTGWTMFNGKSLRDRVENKPNPQTSFAF